MSSFKTIEDRRRETMRLLAQYVERLPLLPETVQAVLALHRHDRGLADGVEALARQDPALAVRMVFVANHTFNFSRDREVTLASILALAGASRIAESVRRIRGDETPFADQGAQRSLWLHSLQVAMAARYFSQQLSVAQPPAEEAYLCGLLHDLGRIVLLATAGDKAAELNERHWTTGAELVALEQEICGFDHATLGWLACRTWNFPDIIGLVNKLHHAPSIVEEGSVPASTATLVRLIGLADELSLIMTQDEGFVTRDSALRIAAMAKGKIGRLADPLGLALTTIDQFIAPLDAISRTRLARKEPGTPGRPAFAATN